VYLRFVSRGVRMGEFWVRRSGLGLILACLLFFSGGARAQAAAHTDPLNLDPLVHQGFGHFYDLDFDAALKDFNKVAQQHPQDPMAWNYILVVTIFRELYQHDLLDTTYYAHDSFLFSKREINISKQTHDQINSLTDKIISMCNARLDQNSNDKNALFARGYAKGMHAAFITLADHSFTAAARQGLQARNDSEAALKIDPQYADAKMAVGIQQFAVASLPRFLRFVVGVFGVGGSKSKGIALLRDSAQHGVITSVESRTALSLFLRHDGRYPEALQVERSLADQYPHDYLFVLEVANLLKDEGHGYEAIAAYKQVLADAQKPGYFIDPRLQMAWFGLAETERGYNQLQDAVNSYVQAAGQPNCSDWLRRRAQVNAGEVYDMLHQRAQAVKMYQMATAGGDQSQTELAREYLKTPYVGK
jgi:tetratricopeptide (TPR) repeat protein